MASVDDLVSNLKNGVTNLSQMVKAFEAAFPRITGSFTMANQTTTVVTQPSVAANSQVYLSMTNGTAAYTQRTAGLFVSALTPGASFAISTQNGTAQGSEAISYFIINPA